MKRNLPSAIAALVLLVGQSVHAVSFSISATAPTVNGADIANLSLVGSFSDFGSSFMWPDRPARGQTFTTGASPFGYLLDAITIQTDRASTGTRTQTIRIGSISGTAFTLLRSEEASFNNALALNDYITYLLASPVVLAPSTTYGFDTAIRLASGSFSTVGWAPLNNPQTSFTGGTAYSSTPNGVGGATISTLNQDRIFHLNLAAVVIPEPATASLALLGMGGLMMRRRRLA